MSSDSRIRRRWTAEEDHILSQGADSQLSQGLLKNWNRIAAKLPGRTNKDCRKRWSKIGENVKKGVWSSSEDQRLWKAVQQYGQNWTQVAQVVSTRHADQCAKRWQYSLDPIIDHSEWKLEDDDRLVAAVNTYGRSWKVVREKEFPTRSTTDLKNRYGVILRRSRQSPEPITSPSVSASYSEDNVSLDLDPLWSDDGMLSGGHEASMPPQTDDVLLDSDALFNFDPQDFFGPGLGQTWQTPHATMHFSNENLFERQNNMSLQGPFQNTNAFSFDQTWTCDPAFLTASPNILTSVDPGRRSQAQEQQSRSRTMLAPYEVEPEALDSMFNTAYKSRTKMAMEAYY